MPGQRKRKQRREAELRSRADRYRGWRWQLLHSTQDHDEFRSYLRGLRDDRSLPYDESRLRLDVLCGRLVHPTTYRVSVLVPPDEPVEGP
ncbi:hypothetical protein [Kitasatospora phosalacinea]|uniref:Uncharacterized protein n=1 Tax=Kitasatospora phosalacinea TaxID=2065 RepID=A0ABW6GJB9_9ACTN